MQETFPDIFRKKIGRYDFCDSQNEARKSKMASWRPGLTSSNICDQTFEKSFLRLGRKQKKNLTVSPSHHILNNHYSYSQTHLL